MYYEAWEDIMLVEKVCKKLLSSKIDYAIVGGYAVALHGAVRGTMDLDLVIKQNLKSYVAVETALVDLGFEARLPVSGSDVFNFREEYIKNKNLIAWSFYNLKDPSEIVDIVITHDLNKLKKKKISVNKLDIFILSKSDLITMKKASGRPQDLADIDALERLK
jgi:hypothetical protein